MIEVDKITVAHYSPLVERKKRFSQDLQKLNLECEWYEQEPDDDEQDGWCQNDRPEPRVEAGADDAFERREGEDVDADQGLDLVEVCLHLRRPRQGERPCPQTRARDQQQAKTLRSTEVWRDSRPMLPIVCVNITQLK